jgi:hypothetical protein
VVADNDEPGRCGAARAAEYLDRSRVTVMSPPAQYKDMRAWIAAGANRQDVETLARETIDAAMEEQVQRVTA